MEWSRSLFPPNTHSSTGLCPGNCVFATTVGKNPANSFAGSARTEGRERPPWATATDRGTGSVEARLVNPAHASIGPRAFTACQPAGVIGTRISCGCVARGSRSRRGYSTGMAGTSRPSTGRSRWGGKSGTPTARYRTWDRGDRSSQSWRSLLRGGLRPRTGTATLQMPLCQGASALAGVTSGLGTERCRRGVPAPRRHLCFTTSWAGVNSKSLVRGIQGVR